MFKSEWCVNSMGGGGETYVNLLKIGVGSSSGVGRISTMISDLTIH